MNFLSKWFVQKKLNKILQASGLAGYRTQIVAGLYLLTVFGQSQNWFPSPEIPELIKSLLAGTGLLTLSAKIRRNGPQGVDTPIQPKP